MKLRKSGQDVKPARAPKKLAIKRLARLENRRIALLKKSLVSSIMERSSNKPPLDSIEAILRLEKENERDLALHQRLLHAIGGFVGTAQFVVLQCVIVAAWIAFNSSYPNHAIDEFPYPLLATFLSLEAVLLTSCVLIRQGLIDRTLERRDHLELQINLLAEREATRSLRILQALAAKLQVATNECEPDELTSDTSIKQIARELRAREDCAAD